MPSSFEVYEDKRDFQEQGITGEVTRYQITDMQYPCFLLSNTAETPIPMYALMTLKSLLLDTKVKEYTEEELNSVISMYFKDKETVVKLGVILPRNVKAFINSFETYDLKCFYSENKELEGDMMFVLSN